MTIIERYNFLLLFTTAAKTYRITKRIGPSTFNRIEMAPQIGCISRAGAGKGAGIGAGTGAGATAGPEAEATATAAAQQEQ